MTSDNVLDAAAQAKPGLENRHEFASKKANVHVFKVELFLIPLSEDFIFLR